MSADQPLNAESDPPAPPDAKDERPKTPEKAVAHPEQEDTPAKPHSVHTHSFRNGTLPKKREVLVEELGFHVPEVPLEIFEDFYLPPLNESINLEEVYASLKDDPGVLLNERWTAFQIDPAQSPVNEDATFGLLQKIFDKMAEFAIKSAKGSAPDLKETVVLSLQPNVAPGSEKEGLHRPDAFFIRRDAENLAKDAKTKEGQTRWWYDIALTGEFKKKGFADQRDDDVSKMIYNMQYVMSLDPCRRFTFGFTIEDLQMRLWFCSRTVVAVSTPFNFATNWQQLTRIFLSFAFASETELGWDSTIRPLIDLAKKRSYYVDIGDKTYKTVDVLSDFAADALVGRATRVFTVQEKGSDKMHVLKDLWVEDDRELEHITYQRILADVEKKFGPEIRNKVARHLLTPIAHQIVTVETNEEDHTTKVMMRGKPPSFEEKFKLVLKEPIINDNQKSVGHMTASDMEVSGKCWLKTPLPPHRSSTNLQHRRHYRIVFKELAKPIHTLRKLSDVFTVLMEVADVLRWIHASGWVHRDISVGNLYLFEGRGLIGDLEYAKRKFDNVSHEVRTGTIDFMAVEAVQRAYLNQRVEEEDISNTESRPNAKMKADDVVKLGPNAVSSFFDKRETQENASIPPFSHNDLHDMESLWWIIIWELFFFRDKSETETDEKSAERQLAAGGLFPRTLDTSQRSSFLQAESRFKEKTAWFPSSFRQIRVALNGLRRVMLARYKNHEASFPDIRETTIDGLHENFREEFLYCVVLARNIELEPVKTTGMRRAEAEPRDDNQPSREVTPTNVEPPNPPVPNPPHGDPSAASDTVGTAVGPAAPSSSRPTHGSKRKADDDGEDDMIYPQPQPRIITKYAFKMRAIRRP